MFWLGLAIGLVLTVARLLYTSFFRVEQGHVAVLTRFGRAVRSGSEPGSPLRIFDAGLHRKAPWDEVVDINAMDQWVELTGEQGGRNVMAGDGILLRIDAILRYAPDPQALEAFLFQLKAPVQHVTGLFTCLLRNEIARFEGATPDAAQDEGSYAVLRRERRALLQRIEAFCHENLGVRYGLRATAVDLVDVLPPDELGDALNAVMQSRAEVGTLVARAEADARRRELAAEQGVAVAQARAKATEIEIDELTVALAELHRQGTLTEYVARRTAEVLGESRTLFRKSNGGVGSVAQTISTAEAA